MRTRARAACGGLRRPTSPTPRCGRSSCPRTPLGAALRERRQVGCRRAATAFRWYFPVSSPLASGKYGMNARSCFRHTSSTPFFSGARRSKLYSFCTLTNRAMSRCALINPASSIISPEKLLQPISRTFPARTRAVERAECLLERRRLIREVQLVEVDVVGLQSLQGVLARTPDVRGGCAALALVVDRDAELGRDQRLIAAAAQRPPEELLASSSRRRCRPCRTA